MLLPAAVARGVADGSVTLAFRRWAAPRVREGSTFRTVAGVLRVEGVTTVDPEAITDGDARAAGARSADEVRSALRGDASLTTYRVALAYVGPDPRTALREDATLGDDDVAELDRRLDRLDRAGRGRPWTAAVLEAVARRPGTRSADLADELSPDLGLDQDRLKLRVRRLKELGLTRSLEVGYELSPRGREYLRRSRRPLSG